MIEVIYQETESEIGDFQHQLDRAFELLFEEVIKSYPQGFIGNYEQLGILYKDEIYDQR